MARQPELIPDPEQDSLRSRIRERAKGRRGVTGREIVDEMLAAREVTEPELQRYAKTALVKVAKDTLAEINPTTGVPDFETLPGTDGHAQIEMFTRKEYEARISELLALAHRDLDRVVARVDYFRRRWGRMPTLPDWFTRATKEGA